MKTLNQLKSGTKELKLLFGITVLVLGFLYASKMAYEDELFFEKNYCEKVSTGAWPDYNKNFAYVCTRK